MSEVQIKVGQVWRDRDPRMNGRRVVVEGRDGVAWRCRNAVTGRETSLKTKTLMKAFELVTTPEEAR